MSACPVCDAADAVVASPYFPGAVCPECATSAGLAAADLSPEDSPEATA